MRIPSIRWFLVLFGAVNAFTYAGLLPLWEGFDEPFHFGYVQHLATAGTLPQTGVTPLSQEVRQSIELAPGSHVVQMNIPDVMTYAEFYALSVSQQQARMTRLHAIDPNLRTAASIHPNYQAHHPPLAFAMLAPFETLFASIPIARRVMLLRCVAGIASVALMYAFAIWLAGEIGLSGIWVPALLLCTFCSQMYYASVAHVCNDWLAIPLVCGWMAAACRYVRAGTLAAACLLGSITALGLLTKAYFLVLVPLLLLLLLWRRSVAPALACLALVLMSFPWYWRNVVLYGNVSGTLEASRVGLTEVLSAAASVPWLSSIAYMARASVWTGNNSFTNFSVPVINAYLLLIAVLVVCYFVYAERVRAGAVVAAACGVFVGGIAYATVASYVFTQGRSAGASPWYMQPLLVPVLALCMLGARAAGKTGRILAAALTMLSVYLMAATYFAKLIPLYSGFTGGKATLMSLFSWYSQTGESDVMLLPRPLLMTMALLLSVAAIGLAAAIVRGLMRDEE